MEPGAALLEELLEPLVAARRDELEARLADRQEHGLGLLRRNDLAHLGLEAEHLLVLRNRLVDVLTQMATWSIFLMRIMAFDPTTLLAAERRLSRRPRLQPSAGRGTVAAAFVVGFSRRHERALPPHAFGLVGLGLLLTLDRLLVDAVAAVRNA